MRLNIRSLLPFFVIIGAFLVIGAVLITSGVLPEERAQHFRSLTDITIATDMKVIKEPTLGDNTFIYAINDVAQRGIDIAQGDQRVRQILDDAQAKQATVTIAAVQPAVMIDRQSGESLYSSAGQVVITSNCTSNWQTIGGAAYPEPQNFAAVADRNLESHQQIWHVLVDVDNSQVTQINQQANRIISDTINPEIVRTEVNMFMPNAIVVDAGSIVRWINPSNLPHNVVGIFNQTTAQDAVNSTGLIINNSTNNINNNNTNANGTQSSPSSSSGVTAIDSGFIQQGQSWQYNFDEAGVFNYLCTIHAEEGMRGTLIITATPASS